MNKGLKRVLDSGINSEQSNFIQKRIQSSNVLGLVLGPSLALVSGIIAWRFFPSLIGYAVSPVILFTLVFLLNLSKATLFSRVYLSVCVVAWAGVFHAGLIQEGATSISGLSQLQLALAVVSIRLMDPREKAFYPTIFGVAIITLAFPLYKSWFNFEASPEMLQEFVDGPAYFYTLLAAGIFFFVVLVMLRDNREFEDRAESLLGEAEEQTKQREESEKELRINLEKLQTAQEEERERQWIAQGLAELQGIMRQNSDQTKDVYDNVLSFIVNYLGVNQGALLTVEREDDLIDSDDDGYIELKSTYAYKRKKYMKRDIAIGEGLIGQAFLERDYIYLTEVPSDYVNITSGLGEARPRSVMIMPLMENEMVQGFIELASFKEMAPYHITYLEQAASSVASFLRSTRVNQRTKELLIQAQQQAEEMNAQEEEMRQNTEEIYAMTKMYKKKDKDNKARIAELKGRVEELEEQLNESVKE